LIPRAPLLVLVAIPLAFAFAAIWSDVAVGLVVAWNAAVLGIAAVDALRTTGTVRAGRAHAEVQAVGRPFSVSLWVENRGSRPLVLAVTDAAPGEPEGLPIAAQLPPGRRLDATYTTRVLARGRFDFGPITVRWRSPMGLWDRQQTLETPSAVRVYPDFEPLRRLDLQTALIQERAPVRARRRPGGENEFERLRPYVAGDPMKHIDWRATARKRELVTREFGQEANQNLLFLLDCGRSMGGQVGSLRAFDHALNAAVMMGEVALRHGDRVGALAFDSAVRAWLPPAGGRRSGGRLVRALYDLQPSLDDPDYALAFRHMGQRVRRRSLVVLLTTVVDAPTAEQAHALVRGLARRHLVIHLWLRDATLDRWVDQPGDDALGPFRRGAAAELVAWRERALADLKRAGAWVVDCPDHELAPQLVAQYLEIKARRLLA
jgi:uncharacterized protein (DUF58 family)